MNNVEIQKEKENNRKSIRNKENKKKINNKYRKKAR